MNRLSTGGRKIIRRAADELVGHIWIVRSDGSALTCGYSRRDKRTYPIVTGTKWPASGTGGTPVEMSRGDFARLVRQCRRRGYAVEHCQA